MLAKTLFLRTSTSSGGNLFFSLKFFSLCKLPQKFAAVTSPCFELITSLLASSSVGGERSICAKTSSSTCMLYFLPKISTRRAVNSSAFRVCNFLSMIPLSCSRSCGSSPCLSSIFKTTTPLSIVTGCVISPTLASCRSARHSPCNWGIRNTFSS